MRHCVFAAGFVGMLVMLGAITAWRTRPDGGVPGHGRLSGDWARRYEKAFDQQFPLRQFGVNLWAAFDFLILREGRAGVVIGRDGWLYTDEEFSVGENMAEVVAANLDEIERVRRTLAERKVQLLIAVVPAKAIVYPEHLGAHRLPPERRALHAALLDGLSKRQIPVVDLLPALDNGKREAATFFRTDTHWTPRGAALAATAIAGAITEHGWSAGLPGAHPARAVSEAEHRGDLVNFLPLDPWFARWLPPVEAIERYDTEAADLGAGDLLGDAPLPSVALVGTSYSANSAWHFAGFLESALGEGVANYAKEGQGPFAPMQLYLGGADYREHPPRLVIWEFPERALALPGGRADAGQS